MYTDLTLPVEVDMYINLQLPVAKRVRYVLNQTLPLGQKCA